GGAAFEILLTIVLVFATAGAGVAVQMASKGRLIRQMKQLGERLKELAELKREVDRYTPNTSISSRSSGNMVEDLPVDNRPVAKASPPPRESYEKTNNSENTTTQTEKTVQDFESDIARSDGISTTHLNARKSVAHQFYAEQGMPVAKIEGHLSGIDFSKPVEVTELPKGKAVHQYQVPGGPQGNYYAEPGIKPEKLGISDKAKDWNTGEIIVKEVNIYETENSVKILKSTAAEIDDTWSIPGETIRAEDGANQYFTMDRNSFKRQ
ncbi:MAG: polymorphic toxin type 46 domain-containing protein, partial [Endozoicomonas sp.]|uniref:polymorphic toxin type 46 domain-containing protein n=1 Tax=Endozoicomonas sp. TaxID=1892382 RepID=UPI003D9BC8CE